MSPLSLSGLLERASNDPLWNSHFSSIKAVRKHEQDVLHILANEADNFIAFNREGAPVDTRQRLNLTRYRRECIILFLFDMLTWAYLDDVFPSPISTQRNAGVLDISFDVMKVRQALADVPLPPKREILSVWFGVLQDCVHELCRLPHCLLAMGAGSS